MNAQLRIVYIAFRDGKPFVRLETEAEAIAYCAARSHRQWEIRPMYANKWHGTFETEEDALKFA